MGFHFFNAGGNSKLNLKVLYFLEKVTFVTVEDFFLKKVLKKSKECGSCDCGGFQADPTLCAGLSVAWPGSPGGPRGAQGFSHPGGLEELGVLRTSAAKGIFSVISVCVCRVSSLIGRKLYEPVAECCRENTEDDFLQKF